MAPRKRILQPPRLREDRRAPAPAEQPPGAVHGPGATPPGHGGIAPGQGGIIPGIGIVVAALGGGHVSGGPASDSLNLLYSNTLAAPGPIDTGANGVPQTATHLLIYTHLRSTLAASDSDLLALQFNGSTTGYVWQRLAGVVLATSVTNSGPDTQMLLGEMPATNPTAGGYGDAVIFIPNYRDTTTLKTGLSIWGRIVSGNGASGINFGWWPQTVAVNQIRIYANSANPNLATGSSVYIYGIV